MDACQASGHVSLYAPSALSCRANCSSYYIIRVEKSFVLETVDLSKWTSITCVIASAQVRNVSCLFRKQLLEGLFQKVAYMLVGIRFQNLAYKCSGNF